MSLEPMRFSTKAALLVAMAVAGCSSGPPTYPLEPSGGGAGTGASTGSDTLLVHGTLSDGTTNTPLLGAQVCLLGSSTCTLTTQGGSFSVSGAGSGFSGALTNFATVDWPLSSTSDFGGNFFLRESARVTTWAQQAGTTFDTSTGALYFETLDSGGNDVAGVSVTIAASGAVVGYLQTDGKVSAAATSTSTQGVGYFFQIPPSAAMDVTFVRTGRPACSIWNHFGWLASKSGTLSAPIVAGQLTIVRAECP